MLLALFCILILLYGFHQYMNKKKENGAIVFFFFLTEGFHFLNKGWCPVKYTDFAVIYLVGIVFINLLEGNVAFFRLKTKIYKITCILGLFIFLEFLRTILLKEESFSFALANYRTYIPFFSFFIAQELKISGIKKILKLITIITIIGAVLYVIQPLIGIQTLQHAGIGRGVGGTFRYRNIPYLAYFYILYSSVKFDSSRIKNIVMLLLFLVAVILTQHRAVLLAYIACIALYFLMSKRLGRLLQIGVLGIVLFAFWGNYVIDRFSEKKNDHTIVEDVENVVNLDYQSAVSSGFENEGGTLSFRVLLLIERVDYMLKNPDYLFFGIGTRHEDSPATQRDFSFILGTLKQDGSHGQISSSDLAWLNPLMRFGLIGISLFIYLSYLIIAYLYKNRKRSAIAMSAFLFYVLLIAISLKNDHLYGNMQLFFVFLLIEYIRKTNRIKTIGLTPRKYDLI